MQDVESGLILVVLILISSGSSGSGTCGGGTCGGGGYLFSNCVCKYIYFKLF